MLGVGSAFGDECEENYVASQENLPWDGTIATTAPCDTTIAGKKFYTIKTAKELAWFAAQVNATSKDKPNPNSGINAILMKDLDLNGLLWTPIAAGKGDTKFSGIFDGNGHKISGMYIDGSRLATETTNLYCAEHDNKPTCNAQNLGFVGTLGGGTIKNLILENVNIHATTNAGTILGQDQQISVGAFVGWMAEVNNNVVEKCMVTGSIRTTGNDQGVGGIVGNAKKGTISDCLSLVEIMTSGSKAYIGGIIGITKDYVTVQSCVYAGPELKNIGTNGAVGGIAGNVYKGTLIAENDYYEGNQLNGVGKNCGECTVTSNNTEKVDISNKDEIACKLNGGTYNDAACDKTGAWSIGETTLSLFDYGVDGYKIYFYANGGKFADGSESKNKFLDVGMTITPEDIEDPSHEDKTFIGWSLVRNATEPAENLGTVSESDTVFAVWQPKLTVTFNVSHGVFPDENVDMKTKKVDKDGLVTVGGLGTLPTSYCAEKSGDECIDLLYFTGWAWAADAKEQDTVHLEDIKLVKDTVLYAVWTKVETYTVSYNANGHGKTRVDYVRVGDGDLITDPENPIAHDGYEFVGWFTEASCVDSFDFKTEIHESIILYAKWNPINYKITYEVGEGSANADNPNKYNVESETINLKAPTPATGFSFDDWFTDDAFSKKVTKIAKGSTGDKTFYAKWSTKTYRITYLADNYSYGSVSDQFKEHGKTITLLSSGIFRRNDCEQTGWATSANGTKVYDLNSNYSENADLTLFPSWKALHTYTIEYVCEGCTNNPQNPTEYTVLTSSGIKNPSRVPEGYKFGGWFKEKGYKNKVTQIAVGTTGDMVLYGKLNKIYNITYKGSDNPNSATTYTVDDAVTLNAPKTRDGYTFEGWFDNEAFDGDAVAKIAKGSTGDKTFYAKWRYTVTYTADAQLRAVNADVHDSVATGLEGVDFTLASAVKDFVIDGYKLDGWSTTDGGNAEYELGASYDGPSITLYSHWTLKTYTITYVIDGVNVDLTPSEYSVEDDVTLPVPTKDGYKFEGWLDSKTSTTITTLPQGSVGDRTLTAQWSFIPIVTHYGAMTITEYEAGKKKAEMEGCYGEHDGEADTVNIPKDIVVESVTFNREFKVNVPSTFTLPFDIDVEKIQGAKFFAYGGVLIDKGLRRIQANRVKSGILPANTPYMIIPTATKLEFEGPVVFRKTVDPVVKIEGDPYEFHGVYAYKTVSEEEEGAIYGMLGKDYNGLPEGRYVRFLANTSYFYSLRAYIVDTGFSKPKASFVKSSIGNQLNLGTVDIGVDWNDGDGIYVGEKTTGIHNVKISPMKVKMDRTYDLKGRLVEGTFRAKGVYINKKVK